MQVQLPPCFALPYEVGLFLLGFVLMREPLKVFTI